MEWMKGISSLSSVSLRLEEAFQALDKSLLRPLVSLWDGLDTGFGNDQVGRERREEALKGLLTMVLEWEKTFSSMHFKVLLREDIWRSLSFENKSHLYGRSVVLRWSDQNSFLKVILKRLWRSKRLKEFVSGHFTSRSFKDLSVEHWADEDVVAVWNLIAGERMSGGKTAFTRNWVWSRLGDANDDHAPRHLLQLFHEAVEKEKEQERRTPYGRSSIRPNTLVKVLPEVPVKALDALVREEFEELQPLIERLKEIAKTPFMAVEIDGRNMDLNLGQEVGLFQEFTKALTSRSNVIGFQNFIAWAWGWLERDKPKITSQKLTAALKSYVS
ncbi:MAG: hypothetical protein U5J62_01900 [Desulfurivibrio sp.]|nr:hypothetical protein [Desulfurivibrio sp.]